MLLLLLLLATLLLLLLATLLLLLTGLATGLSGLATLTGTTHHHLGLWARGRDGSTSVCNHFLHGADN